MTFPSKNELTICFAHVAYRMADRFAARNTGIRHFQVNSLEELTVRIADADVVSVSMMWRNNLIARAPKLKFIQSISAGTDQYQREALKAAGIRLASAQGVNARAVAEHAMSLILAMSRQLHFARDNQVKHHWRGMISDLSKREDELGGKTLLVVGLGRIGSHLAGLAQGVRHAGDRHEARSGLGRRERRRRVLERTARRGLAARGFRRAHLSADAADRGTDQRADARADEAVRLPDQRGARQGGGRAGADRGAHRRPHRGRGDRLHGRGAAAGRPRRCGISRTC